MTRVCVARSQVPKGLPTLFIAQEFLDALPVHQFQYTKSGWRERLVDINVPGAGGASVDGAEEDGGKGKRKGKGNEKGKGKEADGEPSKDELEADFR